MTRGWFPWEREGYPFWANLRHARTWWEWRHLPNVLCLHYNDLLTDLEAQCAAIAAYLEIDADAGTLHQVARDASFVSIRARADELIPEARSLFIGGASSFIYKGTNGRWKQTLDDTDLMLYEEAATRELPEDCRRWLERAEPPGDTSRD
jgi:aryl sulfotransferase